MPDFLDTTTTEALLAYAQAHQVDFAPTGVRHHGTGRPEVDEVIRKSLSLPKLPEFLPTLRSRIFDRAGELMAALGMSSVEISGFETQLVASGDGAFYKRHIDTTTRVGNKNLRVLSGVYYFHRMPKAFSGGALRLYNIRSQSQFVDVEPAHNTLLLFPSWALHEVMPVSCPSREFMDSRFSINCWVYSPAGPRAMPPPSRALSD